MIHTTHLEELALATLPEQTQTQVKDLLRRIVEAFQDESPKLNKTTRKATITVKIVLEHTLENRTTAITMTVEGKLPGYRGVSEVVRMPHGSERFLIETDSAHQIDMYTPDQDDGGVQ